MSMIGTRVLRVEDRAFLTTGGVYGDDLTDPRLTGALWITFVRSPVAHAAIRSIDADAARALPGVVGVLTAADLDDVPAQATMPGFPEAMAQPLLATDTVRYVGEPVAAVLTESSYDGEDAAELVDVDYDLLPVLLDLHAAAADEQVLFPQAGTNTVMSTGEDAEPDFFAGCEVVVSHEIVNRRLAPSPMEVRSGAAVWGADGRLTCWCSTQAAQASKRGIAASIGVPADDVHVIAPDVGGGFGAKTGSDPEYCLMAWAARKFARPVRWTESRSENLVGMAHGRAQVQTVTIGGRRDGTMTAYRLHVLQDCGAYPRLGAFLPSLTALMAPGVYGFERVSTQTRSVVTTTTPTAAYRGAGRPEATAAIERAVDIFAAEIGMDPAEVRRVNMLPEFTEPLTTPTGAVYDSGDFAGALQGALDAAGYKQLRAEQAARRERGDTMALGIGLSVYVEITGGGGEAGPPKENASVEVHPDGRVTVLTGTSPHGQGHVTAWSMLASDELGVPLDKITVRWGDTDLVPEGGGTMGSRSLQVGGTAVRQAARELVELARTRAAAKLEVAVGDLELDLNRAGLQVAGVPDSFVSFADLAAEQALAVRTVFEQPGPTFPFGAHVAVVEVDTDTGKARLIRLVALDDAGTILNPLLAEGQRQGGLALGAGQALLEEVAFDEGGNPLTSTLASYPFVSAPEMPSFELIDMATPTSYNSLGAKGIGESATIGSTPAVQNAVVDALAHLGVRHIDMPTSPQRIWDAIQQARTGG